MSVHPIDTLTIPPVLVGAFLDRLADQINQIVINAGDVGHNLQVQAGREVALAIQNIKDAYLELLSQSIDKIDKKARTILDRVASMVQEVQHNNAMAIQTITMRAQQIANTLPFADRQPQFTRFSPHFIAPSIEGDVLLKCCGNFRDIGSPAYAPRLTIKEKTYTSISQTTQELHFSVPSTVFSSQKLAKLTSLAATLSLPWRKPKLFGLIKIKKTDHHPVLMNILPDTVGRALYEYVVKGSRREEQECTSGGFHVASTREAGNNDRINVPCYVTAPAGWHIVQGTSKAIVACAQGDYSGPNFISDDGDRVVYQATTIHHGMFGSSGSMDFRIHVKIYRDVPTSKTHKKSISLKWGESHVLDKGESWKVIFNAFDGSKAEFTGPSLSNRYIKLRAEGDGIVICAVNPSTLSLGDG